MKSCFDFIKVIKSIDYLDFIDIKGEQFVISIMVILMIYK